MSLHGYADRCRQLADELAESLHPDEVACLHDWLVEVGPRAWLAWQSAHAKTVAAYVAATPSARTRRQQWQTDRPPLVLAAYEHCHRAADLLSTLEKLEPGLGYRAMAATAGTLFQSLQCAADWPDWPWDDPDPYDASEFWQAAE